MRRATWIPLHRQPPVWLITCVVLASLSPVMLRAFGVELGPKIPVAPVATAQAQEPADAPIVGAAARPLAASLGGPVMGSMPVDASEVVIFDDVQDDAQDDAQDDDQADDQADAQGDDLALEPDAASDAEPVDAAQLATAEPAAERQPEARETKRASRPTELAEAKAACRRGNKDVARSVYRDLPVGDARRREIRRACRQEGVWIL